MGNQERFSGWVVWLAW